MKNKLLYCNLYSSADRAKQIKTKATVNEDPTEKLIRELQEENEKLKAMLGGNVKMDVNDLKDEDEELSDEGQKHVD